MTVIRTCKDDELRKVSQLHIKCFPDTFSTALGKSGKGRLLERYYREYYKRVPELFFVAEDEGEIIGLCMGFYCEWENYSKEFLKNNFFAIGFRMVTLLVTGNKVAWKKVSSIFSKKESQPQNDTAESENELNVYSAEEQAEILSVCVSPEYRGTSVASDLMDAFLLEVKNQNRKICGLTVRKVNKRAIAFYEKMGFCSQTSTDDSIHMVKTI